mgnify:CR=1 FL=1
MSRSIAFFVRFSNSLGEKDYELFLLSSNPLMSEVIIANPKKPPIHSQKILSTKSAVGLPIASVT